MLCRIAWVLTLLDWPHSSANRRKRSQSYSGLKSGSKMREEVEVSLICKLSGVKMSPRVEGERERSVRESEIKISRAPTSFAVWEAYSATRRNTVCEPSPSPGIIYISAKWGLYRRLVLHVPITQHYERAILEVVE